MPFFRPTLARHAESLSSTTRLAAREALERRRPASTFPFIPKCPAPTCVCAEMPDLDIEREANLNSSMAPYAEHILISSGQHDWKSKIENEGDVPGWGQLTSYLKTAFGRGGGYQDPFHNVLISTSSFDSRQLPLSRVEKAPNLIDDDREVCTEAVLFPSFKHLSLTPAGSEQLIKQWLLPETLHLSYDNIPEAMKRHKIRSTQSSTNKDVDFNAETIDNPTILICSHASRDKRCGILGPLLRDEFAKYFKSSGVGVEIDNFQPLSHKTHARTTGETNVAHTANIGLISHIGGHKWAGNVIVYVPPGWTQAFEYKRGEGRPRPLSALAGMGIWYGRVEPRHVQGIVEETLLKGRVIKELFRGGIGQEGQVLRL